MMIAICIDDNNGMLFNKRRQSRDKAILQDLLREEKKVWIHSFSEKLFQDYAGNFCVNDNFLTDSNEEELCFVENQSLKTHEEHINELIVYKWNRNYPADFYLDLDLSTWALIETTELAGNSHKKITKERYRSK